MRADEAVWSADEGLWRLRGGERKIIDDAVKLSTPEVLEGFKFTPELALTYRRAKDQPLELSFSEIQELMRREPGDSAYRTLWHYLLTFPLANVVLLLVALGAVLLAGRTRCSRA